MAKIKQNLWKTAR